MKRLRRARRHVPATLAGIGFVLLVVALITDAKAAYAWAAFMFAYTWILRDWRGVTWVYEFEGHTASGSAPTIATAVRTIHTIHAEWTDR